MMLALLIAAGVVVYASVAGFTYAVIERVRPNRHGDDEIMMYACAWPFVIVILFAYLPNRATHRYLDRRSERKRLPGAVAREER